MEFRILLFCLFLWTGVQASGPMPPLPEGDTAPDWTLTDLDGVTHNLYSYLDQGYTVVLDFSATWCGPCWSYHNTHILADLWNQYGPPGTNEVMVFFLEGDPSTPTSALYGGPGSQGNWVAGTPYPIIDCPNSTVPNAYQISYFPTLYAVCPDRTIWEPGQASLQQWVNWINSCGMDATATATDAPCFGEPGGSIDATTTGGHGNITYQWSNGQTTEDISNLMPGLYSVTVTDGNGRFQEVTNITVSAPPDLSLQVINVTHLDCFGDSDGSATVSASGGTPGYNYGWSTGQSGSTVTGLQAGSYQVTVTDGNGCQEIQSVVISAPPLLSSIPTLTPANCGNSDGSAVLNTTGGTFPYLYNMGDGPTPNPVFPGLAAGNYSVTVTDANACSLTISFEILDQPGPVADAGADELLDCLASEVTLDGSNSASGNNISYLWTTPDGNIVSGEQTASPLVDAAGDYTLEVTDNATGCVTYDLAIVTEDITPPVADAGAGDTLDCTVPVISLDGSASSQGSQYTYMWETTDGNIVSGNTTLMPDVDEGGTYTLTVTNTTNGCTAASNVAVEDDSSTPVADGGAGDVLNCLQTEVTLDGTGSSAGANYNYNWTTDDGNIVSGSNTLEPLVDVAGTYVLEVVNTDNSCSSIDTVVVTEDVVAPVADAGPAGELNCQTTALTLDGTGSSSGSGFNYLWTTDDGNIASGENSLMPTVDEGGTYLLEVTNTDNGCVSTSTVAVTVIIPVEGLVVNTADVACAGEATGEATLDGTEGTTPYTFEWPDGSTSTSRSDLMAGSYAITITDADGCTDIINLTINEPPQLIANASATGESSAGANDGSATATPSGGTAVYDYLWNTGDTTATINDLAPGNYTVTVTDANACTVVETVTVNEFACAISATIDAVDVSCAGAADGTATVNISAGSEPYTISWSTGGTSATETDLAPGTYTVSIADGNNCPTTANVTIAEPAPVAIEILEVMHVSCFGDASGAATVEGGGGVGGFSYEWPSGNTEAEETGLAAGSYTVTVTDQNGCTANTAVTVNQPQELTGILDIENETEYNSNDGVISAVPAGGNPAYSYVWNTGDTTATISDLMPGDYLLTITDENGCTLELSGTVEAYICPEGDIGFDVTSVSCAGSADGSLTALPNSGTAPFNYLWSTDETTETIEDLASGLYDLTVTDDANCTYTTNVEVPEPDVLELWIVDQVDVECEDQQTGSASVEATGGTADYAYEWSTGAEGPLAEDLAPGTYEVTATDANGCISMLEVTIEVGEDETLPVVITEDIVVELDADGLASISTEMVDNGSYDNCGIENLSLSATDFDCSQLGEQTVTLTVTDVNGNVSEANATVTVVDAIAPEVFCPEHIVAQNCDGLVEYDLPTASDNCGDPALNLIAGLGSGANFPIGTTTETYEVTDAAGNMGTCSFTVTIENTLESAAEVTNACPGEAEGTATVSASGGTPEYSYLWSNDDATASVEGLVAGVYQVTVTDATGCTSVTEVTVEEFPAIEFKLDQVIDEENNNQNGSIAVTVNDGTPPYTYAWFDEDGNLVGTEEDLTGVAAGAYTAEVTDANGCVFVSDPITVDNLTGVEEPEWAADLQLFPNPTDGQLWVSIELPGLAEVQLELFDVQGRSMALMSSRLTGHRVVEQLDLSGLSSGLYYLRIVVGGEVLTRKVIKD